MQQTYKVCILGSGAFGTAMAHCAINNQNINSATIYCRKQEVSDSINKEHKNPSYQSNFTLDPNIHATTNLQEALEDCKFVLCCIPVQGILPFIKENKQYFKPEVPFVSCSKGIVLENGQLISQLIKEYLPNQKYACLSGPSFAQELMQNFPTCIVVASEDQKVAKLIQLGLSSKFLRIYAQSDVIGVELAGALKNIVAIGAGVIQGVGFGSNSQTAYITRSVTEMQKYSRLYGASKHTFYGLSGIGDLMLTSFSSMSRNRSFGVKIGEGMSIQDILKGSAGVVEGLPTLELVYQKSIQNNIDMPTTRVLYEFIKGKMSKEECVNQLMLRAQTDEFEPTFEDLVN